VLSSPLLSTRDVGSVHPASIAGVSEVESGLDGGAADDAEEKPGT
jgi:hypothetical protein